MKKFSLVILGVGALALTGCGDNLDEAVPRAGGMVAEDWHTFRTGCDVPVDGLVVDAEGTIWVNKLAPVCRDEGEAYLYSWGPFNPGIEIPVEEVESIKKVNDVDSDHYEHISHVKVEG